MNPERALALVQFRWGTLDLALSACCVQSLRPDLDPRAPTIGELLGLPGAAPGVMRLLLLTGTGGVPRIRVQEPVIQVRLRAGAIRALPPLLAARLRLPWVRALACRPGGGAPIVILDPGADDAAPAARDPWRAKGSA